jgi:hypothetical protein
MLTKRIEHIAVQLENSIADSFKLLALTQPSSDWHISPAVMAHG